MATLYEPSESSPINIDKTSKKLSQRRLCLGDRDRAFVDASRSRLVQKIAVRAAERRADESGDYREGAGLPRFGEASGLEVVYMLGSYMKRLEESDPDMYNKLRRWFKTR